MRRHVSPPLQVLALVGLTATSGCLKLQTTGGTTTAKPPPPQYMDTKGGFEILDVAESQTPAPYFAVDGQPFCFVGTNNYYLIFKSHVMVDDVFEQAKAMNIKVVRQWAHLDVGSLDGSVPTVDNIKEKVYFQYWDTATGRPAYNDGPDGLERLDYVLHKARETGTRVVLTFTNNWKEFGGMDQYVVYFGLKHHHDFYTDPRAKQAYKDYVAHLLNRVNSIDGVVYKDDPAVFAWELANEPRCKNYQKFDAVDGWDETLLTNWANEMSAFVKSIDPNHMVAVGDEGFLNGGRSHWTYKAHEGVDHEALMRLEHIDYGTFHLYPDNWGTGYKFGYQWITDHVDVARKVNKPTVLEEYGTIVKRDEKTYEVTWGWERRKTAYTNYNNLFFNNGGSGAMFWMLQGLDDYHPSGRYPDYDHYGVYNGEPTGELLEGFANHFSAGAVSCKLAAIPQDFPKSPFVKAYPAPGSGKQARKAAEGAQDARERAERAQEQRPSTPTPQRMGEAG